MNRAGKWIGLAMVTNAMFAKIFPLNMAAALAQAELETWSQIHELQRLYRERKGVFAELVP